MPFIYCLATKQLVENESTSGTGNTQLDQIFLKPGASRVASVVAVRVGGKASALTSLNGLAARLGQWTTTSSTSVGGASVSPTPKHNLAPAAVQTAGGANAGSSGITQGTGGPLYVGVVTMGASGPGAWNSMNIDDVPTLDGGANRSMDVFTSSPLASASWEGEVDTQEG